MVNAPILLKAIQINGFKSFADKLTLEFQPGINVIVGPNGCGKSNIADAVRWVLGEQSVKSLRGNKMEDVIFGGSNSRRPVGRAEVSLIFDNSTGLFPLDFAEVMITRCIYRSGESEYFINRAGCRLKDIQELFLDTGSGKEGFSIIGQGRVEEILNARAEERRLLVEEVAGISKYRVRKKEAVKKLADAEQNIDRLGDIVVEVESRLEPLAEQAERARQYITLEQELRTAEVRLIVQSLKGIQRQKNAVYAENERLSEQKALLSAALAEKEGLSTTQKYALDQLDQHIQTVQRGVFERETGLQDLQHQIALALEREGHLTEQTARLEQEMAATREKIETIEESLARRRQRQQEIREQTEQCERDLAQQEEEWGRLRRLSGAERMEALKNEIFEALAHEANAANKVRELQRQLDNYSRLEEQLAAEELRCEREQDRNRTEQEAAAAAMKEAAVQKEQLENQIREVEHSLTQKTRTWNEETDKLANLTRKIDQKQARYQTLKSFQESREGYVKGVKEVLDAYAGGRVACGRLYGAVAENIRVEDRYEPAIEMALGSALQNIIVENSEDAKTCIAYLKEVQGGRATFLPLAEIKGGKMAVPDNVAACPGYLGLAVDLIEFAPSFRPVMEHLLGRIVVAGDLDAALVMARAGGYRFRIVTLTQDQINLGGSLTGGSRQKGAPILGSRRELDRLAREIVRVEAEREELKRTAGAFAADCEALRSCLDQARNKLQANRERYNLQAAAQKHILEKLDRGAEMQEMLAFQKLELKEQIATAQADFESAGVQQNQAREKVTELKIRQTALEQETKSYSRQADLMAEAVTTLKVGLGQLGQEYEQISRRILEEEQLVTDERRGNGSRREEQEQLLAMGQESKTTRAAIEQRLQEGRRELEAEHLVLIESRQERECLAAELQGKENELKEGREQVQAIETQIHQNELKSTRAQAEWESGLTRLAEDWNLTWEEACAQQETDRVSAYTSLSALHGTVQEVRQKIAEMGPVNHTALNEHPAMVERHRFLTAQRDDLMKAGAKLRTLIDELDQVMKERFAAGFAEVNRAFTEVFQELFEGGYAHLTLDQPDNLLETGINIIAQPPGKKPQLLSLLSGGERAFTAIALLFALLRVKPSPFCIMDEIESALDETNVRRFINYVRRLSANTQFILISHRRGTMEAADRLYGITMEESGVSKMLTIEIAERGTFDASKRGREGLWMDS